MLIGIGVFGWLKKRELQMNEARLRRLKIEQYNEEQKRKRNTPDEFAKLLGQ